MYIISRQLPSNYLDFCTYFLLYFLENNTRDVKVYLSEITMSFDVWLKNILSTCTNGYVFLENREMVIDSRINWKRGNI